VLRCWGWARGCAQVQPGLLNRLGGVGVLVHEVSADVTHDLLDPLTSLGWLLPISVDPAGSGQEQDHLGRRADPFRGPSDASGGEPDGQRRGHEDRVHLHLADVEGVGQAVG
jgi:hypothetical protein